MRYYIYLDRDFLRILFSATANVDFDIEIVEFSVTKNYSNNNSLSVEPCIENIADEECNTREECSQEKSIGEKSENMNKERLGVSFGQGKSYSVQTERRYINIEDISDMKNFNFYHKLIEKIRTNKENNRIIEEIGYIQTSNNDINFENKNDIFFMINNSFVWIDNTKLEGDIFLISKMNCKVNIIGYKMNCNMNKNFNVIKAIAIFID